MKISQYPIVLIFSNNKPVKYLAVAIPIKKSKLKKISTWVLSLLQTWKMLRLEGLPREVTEQDLWQYFEDYGHVVDAKVIPSLGHGHVEYNTAEEARRAMDSGDRVCEGISKHYIGKISFTAQPDDETRLSHREVRYCAPQSKNSVYVHF